MQVSISGRMMTYEEHGSGPTVVLLHDTPLCRDPWQLRIRPLVAAGFRVIVPELSGIAEGATPQVVDMRSDDVVRLLNYLGIGRVAVAGMAMGGDVALSLLERHPHRLAATVLVACPSGTAAEAEHRRRAERLIRLQPEIPTMVMDAEREGAAAGMKDAGNPDRRIIDFLRRLSRTRACYPAFRKVA